MGVSKNSGTPKWMVKIMVPNPMNKWMIWGEFSTPYFLVQHPYGPYSKDVVVFQLSLPGSSSGWFAILHEDLMRQRKEPALTQSNNFLNRCSPWHLEVFFGGGRNDVCFMTEVMCFFFVCVANVHTV